MNYSSSNTNFNDMRPRDLLDRFNSSTDETERSRLTEALNRRIFYAGGDWNIVNNLTPEQKVDFIEAADRRERENFDHRTVFDTSTSEGQQLQRQFEALVQAECWAYVINSRQSAARYRLARPRTRARAYRRAARPRAARSFTRGGDSGSDDDSGDSDGGSPNADLISRRFLERGLVA